MSIRSAIQTVFSVFTVLSIFTILSVCSMVNGDRFAFRESDGVTDLNTVLHYRSDASDVIVLLQGIDDGLQ